MKKMIIGGAVLVGLAVFLSGQPWVQSAVFRVEQAIEEHERKDLVENWRSHFDSELVRMEAERGKLTDRARDQHILAKKSEIELAELGRRASDYDQVIRDFVRNAREAEGKVGTAGKFEFCGRQYDAERAVVQMRRYATEMAGVRSRQSHLEKLHLSQQKVAVAYSDAASKLANRVEELRITREHYAVKVGLARVRTELRETETLLRDLDAASDSEESRMGILLHTLEDSLREEEARAQVEGTSAPDSKTASLAESLRNRTPEGDASSRVEDILEHYWNAARSGSSH